MKKVVSFGEIMLRLATIGKQRIIQSDKLNATFGGGESNIAISLAHYGVPTEFVSRLPDNDIADWCISDLKKFGVQTSNIVRGGERLGVYFLESGAMMRSSKVTYDRAYSAATEIRPGMFDWYKIFSDASWFHWTGILPAISQSAADACQEAIEIANKMGLTVSTDLNLRDSLWQYGKTAREVLPLLLEGCDIILGVMLDNKEDEKKIFSVNPGHFDMKNVGKEIDFNAFEQASIEMKKRYPKAKKIVVTLRGMLNANHNTWGACMYSDKLYQSKRYDITHIVDRVGGGDSFMAGLIYGLIHYPNDDQKALEFATATSNIKHTVYGDYNITNISEVERLMSGDTSGRIE